ncbi:MAG: hypothetical protein EXQ71_11070, partial [Acidimicrobiia bacterium]|nr:hypothetical protein [Acidimicrobiia bacterium]
MTVTDRHGASVQGVTNSVGHLSVSLAGMKNDRWPLRVVTEAGTVAGQRFGGHLQAYAWNPGVTHLNLWSTAAARIAGEGRGKSSPSEKNWSSAFERVRTALGISVSASAAVLEGGNRHLDGGRLEARVAAEGGWGTDAYDKLVADVVRAAEKKS